MQRYAQRYIVLVLAQGACLALGLWLEDRFVLSASRPDTEASGAAVNATAADGTLQSVASDCEEQAGAAQETPVAAIRAMAFVWIAALQAVVAYLVLARAHEENARRQNRAEHVSLQRYNDLLKTRDAVIFGLAKLAESRDPDTGNHLERIAHYSTRLASALRRNPRYRRQVTRQFVSLIGISSSLHDIGKVGIADSILLKPGQFEEQERLRMQLHASIGGRCVRDIESRLGTSNFLQMARDIAFGHHERWDGTGYPKGLAGEDIPLAARIVAVADVYDALASKRVYKEAIPHAQCVEMIKDAAGTYFDPGIVAAFLEIEQEFVDIAQRYVDPPETNLSGRACAEVGLKVVSSNENVIDEDMEVAMELLEEYAGELRPPAGSLRTGEETSVAFQSRRHTPCAVADGTRSVPATILATPIAAAGGGRG